MWSLKQQAKELVIPGKFPLKYMHYRQDQMR